MLQVTNNANAAASVHPNNVEHSLAQGADPSHQALLSGLTAWRTQGNLPGLVAQHRDTASRLIEQFLNEPHSLTLDLRGLQLQGLPAKFANLQPILQNRSSAAALAVFRIDHEAFASQAQRSAYHQHLGPHLQVAQPQASASAASTSAAGPSAPSVPPGNPDQHRQWAGCVAAVVGAMREGALPLLDDIVKSLQTLAQREDSTLQTASNFFTTLQAKVNSNISKTNANKHPVCALPQLDYRNPVVGQESMLNVQANLSRIYGVLQYAKASPFHSADNVRKALERVGHLQCVALFIDKMFDCLYTLRQQPPKLAQDLLNLENTLSELHTQCMKAEVRGQPTEHDVVQLTDQLAQQSEALLQAYMQMSGLKQRLGELAQVELPEGLRGMLPLPQQFENWGLQNNQKMEALQLHKNTSLLLGRLANPNLGSMTITNLCTSLAGQLSKVPENSEYWPLIEAHPRPEVRQLAAHRQQPKPVEKPLEAVNVPHTHVALLTQKDAAFEAAAKGDLRALHRCLMKGLDPEVRDEQQQTLLHVAAANGRADLIDWLVNIQKLPLEATDRDGYTSFLRAALSGQTLAMATLSDSNADTTAKDNQGNMAIHLATFMQNERTLEYCKNTLGQSLDEVGAFGRTPLLIAASHGNRVAMDWLKKHGADAHTKDNQGSGAVHLAAMSGNIETLEYCKDILGQRLADTGHAGRTPLLIAASHGNRAAMDWLKKHGADAHTKDNQGNMAIHLATFMQNERTLEYCKNTLGQSLDEVGAFGRTPLLMAASHGNCAAMEWLKKHGADAHTKDNQGSGAVHLAAISGNIETLEYCKDILGQRLADTDHAGRTPLLIAASHGNRAAMDWLKKHGADAHTKDNQGSGAVHLAAMSGNIETLEYCKDILGQRLADTGHAGRTPLLIAASHGNRAAMDWLKKHGADVHATDTNGDKAIHLAAISGNIETLEYCKDTLGQRLADTDHAGRTPLLIAASHGNRAAMDWLKKHGADVHATDINGDKAIHLAAISGNIETLEYCKDTLGQRLADTGHVGRTPLLIAASHGNRAAMDWLKKHGADAHTKDNQGSGAVHLAAMSGNIETLEYCKDTLRQSLAATGFQGQTPLLYAAGAGNLKAMQWLINQGANIHAVDKDGRGLVDLAKDNAKTYAQSLF